MSHRAMQLPQQAESVIAIHQERDTPAAEEKTREATEAAENARAVVEQHQQEATAVSHSFYQSRLVTELHLLGRWRRKWLQPHNL